MKSEKQKRVVISACAAILLIFLINFSYDGYVRTSEKEITIKQEVNISQQQPKEKININTCSKEALISLPGIGETLAERIINNRPYKDIYELDKVKGIGTETISNLKEIVVCN